MIAQGPTPVGVTSNQITILSVSFDLTAHTYVVTYMLAGGVLQSKGGAIPAALQTALETHAQGVVEAAVGWSAGSSSVVTP